MPDSDELHSAATYFTDLRPRLFGIAYRMLGSVAEAEDIVQDVWLRWQAYDRETVREPVAFLTTTTTRLAINVAQSARSRRETYVGPWIPEPVDTSADPELGALRGDALNLAILMVLERLSPTERAAYVLREAFDYPYQQIADILDSSEANARQLVSRARKHVASEHHTPVSDVDQRRLLDAFLLAAREGDFDALEGLLTADVVSYSDGGGVVRASRIPVAGRSRVAKFVAAFADRFWTDTTLTAVQANGRTAMLITRGDTTVALFALVASDAGIEELLWQMNPDKLTAFGAAVTD